MHGDEFDMFAFLLGFGSAVILLSMFNGRNIYKRHSCVAYVSGSGSFEMARLAQDYYESDTLVILMKDYGSAHNPFVIESNKVRFFTDDGHRINEVNWRTL